MSTGDRRVSFFTSLLGLVGLVWLSCLTASPALAGGAWVPERGDGDIQFGYSRKLADSSWTPDGQIVQNGSQHDFRYGYFSGELGFGHRFSMEYTLLYLNGYEGPPGEFENNRGLSEAFFHIKYGVHKDTWLNAISFNIRTSILYDQYGTYDRHLFLPDEDDVDGDGDTDEAIQNKVNSEWRGLLGEDYGLSFRSSRPLARGGWLNMEIGYTYRTGNLADEVPLYGEIGANLWRTLFLKGTVLYVQSVHNNSEPRQFDDRFGCSDTNCFPDASRVVAGVGLLYNVGQKQLWWLEAGWNHWLWGESTRRYGEPYFSVGRRY